MKNMKKDKNILTPITKIDENLLFKQIVTIIEKRKFHAITQVNQDTTIMFWEVGQFINSVVLDNKRAAYGKKILTELAAKLVMKYGKVFSERNLYRMALFAERFPDKKILPPLAAKLSHSHNHQISQQVAALITQGELDPKSNVQNLHIANSDKPVAFYNFYVILTVEAGILVKVQRGVALLSLIQRSKKV